MGVEAKTKASFPTKSRKSSLVDQVPTDILRFVFKRLSFIDLVQAKAVCSSWNLLVEEFVSRMPWLMLPSKEEVEGGDGTDVNNNGYSGFLNPGENQVYSLKTISKEFRESCCIGSSNGWLVFLEEKAVPFLFNPFKQIKIQLPSVDLLLGLLKMERNMEGQYELDYFKHSRFGFSFCNKQQVRQCFIQKAILTGEPDCNNKNYGLILLCNEGEEIAYHESGDSYWTMLDVSHPPYQDIISHKNYLYALSEQNTVEVWDVQGGCVMKKFDIDPPFPEKSLAKGKSFGDLCTNRFYLVESCEDLLLVVRYIGYSVDWDGTLVHEADLLTDHCTHPKVCPYRTCLFHVYKLDFIAQKWVEMESLGDRALFLGGNQSVSVSTQSFPNCEGNSIYFTDDFWEKMEEDYLYGGHDMGIYNLKDESVKPIYEFYSDKIQPPPCWIIPQAMLGA
ncbi:probable F-box protein At4g22165 [Durio zibethinus]|uniref:Probable F-box protein At4g22165 n=1 Tax=Durio zibethinus TaxID=66656 RepID=A0A6P6A8N6_DURZI|nr:probable F-box protein At4g22165 [Durio zibethinus]